MAAMDAPAPPLTEPTTARAFALLALRALVALMLAVIALQATPAQPLTVRGSHGSAFSASTVEVALPLRSERAAEIRAAALPALEPAPILEFPGLPEISRIPEAWPAHRQTGPPALPRPPRWQPAPRAPPAHS